MLDSAREAFVQGLQVTAAVSTAIAPLGSGILAAMLLRGVPARDRQKVATEQTL